MPPAPPATSPTTILPEVEVYLWTLVVATLLRDNLVPPAVVIVSALVARLGELNRRTLDQLQSRAYHYYSLAMEEAGRLTDVRHVLLAAYRVATLRHDVLTQATCLNLLLRNYLTFNQIDQAQRLLTKTNFPETASNSQFVRYLYYSGRVLALRLDYTQAHSRLQQAIRKAPSGPGVVKTTFVNPVTGAAAGAGGVGMSVEDGSSSSTPALLSGPTATAPPQALGFRLAATKLSILVQLLIGDLPERSLFAVEGMKTLLQPYLALVLAVKSGDVHAYHSAVKTHAHVFLEDNNLNLVNRLEHNVVKTGLRKISVSYSRISLADVAAKLGLSDAKSAEYVSAKGIRDGVLQGYIDGENKVLVCREAANAYATAEPQKALHRRITFLMSVHNDAVRAMRYPPKDLLKEKKGKKTEGPQEMTDEELMKALEEEEGDEY